MRVQKNYDLDVALRDICKDDVHAIAFCGHLLQLFHLIDDGVDRDKPADPKESGRVLLAGMHVLSFNQFWLANKDLLWPVVHTTVMDWVESNELLKSEDVRDQMVGHVLKATYQNIFYMVAAIKGGPDHEQKCRDSYRAHDFDP